ncbi:hypothetical protein M3599_18585 [Niallia circulans]|uniref:hypothetical protein n=1 Tax=Niallia circulans TaxID=1397 RepID=UPI000A97DF0F|nr:hypothetical protein [Niallia circulans]MCM2982916.1 hypothetical protein [Niallia circulans]
MSGKEKMLIKYSAFSQIRYKIDEAAFVEKSLHPNGLIATNATASLVADGLFHPKNG